MRRTLTTLLLGLLAAVPATAQVPVGATVPTFTKSLLGGGTVTPEQYRGRVVILFLLGYS